jgi:hypothetical protein
VQAYQCAERTAPPKIVTFLLRKLQKLQYSQLYRLIAQASTHLLGTIPLGDLVMSFERLSPVERSNGRIAVLARRFPKNRDIFCDFVASMGREGPLSILATTSCVAVYSQVAYICIYITGNRFTRTFNDRRLRLDTIDGFPMNLSIAPRHLGQSEGL